MKPRKLPDDALVIDRRGLEWPALELALRAVLYEDEAADAVLIVKDWLDSLNRDQP